MIDWYFVLTSSLWILGLSVVFATASYHRWRAQDAGGTLREQCKRRDFVVPFSAGIILIAVGMATREGEPWWWRAVWIAVAALFGRLGSARAAEGVAPTERRQ
ncbi:MAG: hypothetical protein ACM3NQ_25705 [Bacteroidales bacterium]